MEADAPRHRRAGRGAGATTPRRADDAARPSPSYPTTGSTDDFVGVCHGVIARICPDARVIDITHGVPRHDVRAGAFCWPSRCPFMPGGRAPGGRRPRRRAASGARSRCDAPTDGRLVGPDNGLLWLAAEASGGVVEAVDISRSPFRLEPVSATFHGRDMFAPVAAQPGRRRLRWRRPATPLDPGGAGGARRSPQPAVDGDALVAHVRYVDRFGNVQLERRRTTTSPAPGCSSAMPAVLIAPTAARTRRSTRARSPTSATGELLVYEDARGGWPWPSAQATPRGASGSRVDDELEIRAP